MLPLPEHESEPGPVWPRYPHLHGFWYGAYGGAGGGAGGGGAFGSGS